MARTRQFDENVALDKATTVFWTKGYERTSVQDLVDAMGVQRASLYSVFKDKKTLFRRVLGRYKEWMSQVLIESESPLQGISTYFEELIKREGDPKSCKSCLIVRSALEAPFLGEEVEADVRDLMQTKEDFFFQCLTRAMEKKEIQDPEFDARGRARALVGLSVGLNTLSQINPSRDFLVSIARQGLKDIIPSFPKLH